VSEKMMVTTKVEREGRPTLTVKIGEATKNPDGSITIRLDALPVHGDLLVHCEETKR